MLLNLLQQLTNILDRPQVLAVPNGAEHEFKLLQHSLDYDSSAARMSDVDGLNLNVFAPASDGVSANGGLPVFIFIHGGGFNGGSSSYPPHDMTRFVRLSMARGMPVIGVSLK
jgi:carboxylesterase type B